MTDADIAQDDELPESTPRAMVHVNRDGKIRTFSANDPYIIAHLAAHAASYCAWDDEHLDKTGLLLHIDVIKAGFFTELPVFANYWGAYPDNSTHYLSAKVFPYLENKERTGTIILLEDVTEKSRQEEDYFESKKLEVIGRIANSIAHDFNNILAGISGFSEILMRKLGKDDPSYQLINKIHESALKAAALTSQLLGFARKGSFNPAYISAESLIMYAIGATPGLSSRFIITRDFETSEYKVFADAAQLRQVFIELLKNAVESMDGGGTISIETRYIQPQQFPKHTRRLKGAHFVQITISDTGSGIPEDILRLVFEPHFSTKQRTRHTGIGLSVAFNAAKHHGGTITLESSPSGTKAILILPCEKETHTLAHTPYNRVLVIDDNEETRIFLKTYFEGRNGTVTETSDGKSGIELIKTAEKPFDVIFLDICLPDQDGTDLFNIIRAISPSVRIVFISGTAAEINWGADRETRVLAKPFEIEDVENVLR